MAARWYSRETKEPTLSRPGRPAPARWAGATGRIDCAARPWCAAVQCALTATGPAQASTSLDPVSCAVCAACVKPGDRSLFLTDIEKGRLLAYKESGKSNKRCGRMLGRGVRCVRRWWRRYEESDGEGMARRKSTSLSRCTSAEEDADIVTVNNLFVAIH